MDFRNGHSEIRQRARAERTSRCTATGALQQACTPYGWRRQTAIIHATISSQISSLPADRTGRSPEHHTGRSPGRRHSPAGRPWRPEQPERPACHPRSLLWGGKGQGGRQVRLEGGIVGTLAAGKSLRKGKLCFSQRNVDCELCCPTSCATSRSTHQALASTAAHLQMRPGPRTGHSPAGGRSPAARTPGRRPVGARVGSKGGQCAGKEEDTHAGMLWMWHH